MKILAWPNSSQINTTKYTPDTLTLEVEFKNGSVYQYFKVPLAVWEDLEKQKKEIPQYSVGNWVNKTIKDKYEFLKIK
jgi:KTSC domain